MCSIISLGGPYPQDLETANDPDDLVKGFSPYGPTFNTLQYPNKCAPGSGKRRALLAGTTTATATTAADATAAAGPVAERLEGVDMPLDDAFTARALTLTPLFQLNFKPIIPFIPEPT